MVSADLLYYQEVNYTYFCIGNQHYTWVDHILVLSKSVENLESCHIVSLEDSNLSDHLPISMGMVLHIPDFHGNKDEGKYGERQGVTYNPPPRWTDKTCNAKYRQILSEKLEALDLSDSHINGRDEASIHFENMFNYVNNAVLDASKEAGCTPCKTHEPKNYWSP